MKFSKWLAVFVEEKEIDLSEYVTGKDCMLQVGDVLSAMNSTTAEEQRQIKQILVGIDYKNGDVMHFIRHAAQALDITHKLGV
jgi:hypothetical protein